MNSDIFRFMTIRPARLAGVSMAVLLFLSSCGPPTATPKPTPLGVVSSDFICAPNGVNRECSTYNNDPGLCGDISGCTAKTYHGSGPVCEGFSAPCYTLKEQADCNDDLGCMWTEHECSSSKPCPEGWRCAVAADWVQRCQPDPDACVSQSAQCADAKTLEKKCANGIVKTVTCPRGQACHNGECTSEFGIPEGVFKDPDSAAIFYSNGRGDYCSYRDMAHLWCLTGKKGSGRWDWLNSRPKIDPEWWPKMVYGGTCFSEKCEMIPEGVFKDPDSAAIFYSNGRGDYCSYRDMAHLWCLTGKKGSGRWDWLNSRPEIDPEQYPGMVYGGTCFSEKCEMIPEGVFKDPDSAAIFYSNGRGDYCSYRDMAHLWCLTGKKGSGRWDWLNSRPKIDPEQYPGMVYGGFCYSPKCG